MTTLQYMNGYKGRECIDICNGVRSNRNYMVYYIKD